MGLAFWKKDPHDLETIFEDDFHRADSKSLGLGWLDKGQDTRLEEKALRIRGGWLAGARDIPGNVRIEFEVETLGAARVNLGGFVNGAEGFWNGYDFSLNSDGLAVLRRCYVSMASADKVAVRPGKKYKLSLQRMGSRVSLGLDGKILTEFLDLDPLVAESQVKFGIWAYTTDAKFTSFKAFKLLAKEKLSPLSVGDRLYTRRMTEAALAQYRNALPVLEQSEKELCGLKIGLCLLKLGRPGEALTWLDEVGTWPLSPAGRSRLRQLSFEAALTARSRSHFSEALSKVYSPASSSAERQSLMAILGKLDVIRVSRDLWNPSRVKEDLALLLSQRDGLGFDGACRALLKFGYILGGETLFKEVLEGLGERNPGSALPAHIRREMERQQTEFYYHHRKEGPEAEANWRQHRDLSALGTLESGGALGQPTVILDDAYGDKAEKLTQWFEERIRVRNTLPDHSLFLPVADYLWARGDDKRASHAYHRILEVFKDHGSAACSSLLALSAMAAWKGEGDAAEDFARRVLKEYPAEPWVFAVARCASGAIKPEEYVQDPQRDAFWNHFPSQILPLITVAARFRALGDYALARQQLELILDISFPWEPSGVLAGRYLRELPGSGEVDTQP